MTEQGDHHEDRLGPVEGRPLRAVLLGGGSLEPGAVDLLGRLEHEEGIDLLGVFLEAGPDTPFAALHDVWRRRRWLAVPVLAAEVARRLSQRLADPEAARRRARTQRSLQDRIHRFPDLHAPKALERLRGLDPDLGLVYGAPILRPELFEVPNFGCIGIHHGRLPEYRGKKTTFWEMARGETSAGVTIQRIGAGLDTGAILKQGLVTIGSRPYRRVWADIEALGVELFLEAVLQIGRGEAQLSRATAVKGRLFRDPKARDLLRYLWRGLAGRR